MIMIDSDILIWILRGNSDYMGRFRQVLKAAEGRICITAIQYMEILGGAKETELVPTELFLDALRVIPLDREAGKLAGRFMRQYRKSHGIHNADALIAATAKLHDCRLWTDNLRHYPMLQATELYRDL